MAQEVGSEASPGLALDWVCPLPLHVVTPGSCGAAQPGPQSSGLVQLGWEVLHRGWQSEAWSEEGELWRHKARGRGALPTMAGPAAHSQCMQASPLVRRAQRRRAEPTSQAAAVRAAGVGKQPWQNQSGP